MRPQASIAFLAAACTVGLSACAPTYGDDGVNPTPSPRQCFDSDRVTNFTADSTHTLYVEASNRDVYELQIAGGCNDLDSAFAMVLTPTGGSQSRLCVGDAANLRVGATGTGSQCRARVLRVLTAEQVAALPSRLRP